MKGKLRETGRLLRTLGNERRLRIVNALLQGDLCMCEVDTLRRPQYEVSRDLAALRRLGSWKTGLDVQRVTRGCRC